MAAIAIETDRLRLVPASVAILTPPVDDRDGLGRVLKAVVPDDWPPLYYDDDARQWTLNALEAEPFRDGWLMWYVVAKGAPDEVVGIVGYKGPPDDDGVVEVGYGVVSRWQRRGIATEAVRQLVERAWTDSRVTAVAAETYPHLVASIGVMTKLGMSHLGAGTEPGVVRYQVTRGEWIARGPT